MTPERFTELLTKAAEKGKWYVELFDSDGLPCGKFVYVRVDSIGTWSAHTTAHACLALLSLCEAPRTLHDRLYEIAGLSGDHVLSHFIRNNTEFLKATVLPDA